MDNVIEDFFRAGAEDPKGKKRGRRGAKKKSRKQYKYARTEELYRQNSGLLVKYVREGIDWTEEANPDLSSEDIKSLYDSLWGTKPHIEPPEFEEPEPPV